MIAPTVVVGGVSSQAGLASIRRDRFVVHSRRGEPTVRTNDPAEAERWASVLGGRVTDHNEQEQR